MNFNNEIAVITGGYSGIGGAAAKKLLANGATCVVLGRSADRANEFIKQLPEYEGKLHFFRADVAEVEELERVIEKIGQEFGRMDMLVNSAGINFRKAAVDYTFADWKRIIDTNLAGTFFASTAAAKVMKRHNGGRIVNIGSMLSHYGVHNVSIYGAAKGGVSQITRTHAVEFADYGIRVNQVSPGYIATPFVDLSLPENLNYRDRLINRTPLGRLGTAEDVANMIAFLLSHEASFVTGQIIAVDGGILGGDPTLNPLMKV
ncbi:SDR family NAD(P)-dependent oxidoreductase [Cohnella faecalis]|nr:SDR family oxidoreductase [Cohnella faecalis]